MGVKLRKRRIEEEGQIPGEFNPRTDLGRKLWRMRERYIAGGGKLLNWDELEHELKNLRERDLP